MDEVAESVVEVGVDFFEEEVQVKLVSLLSGRVAMRKKRQ